METKQMTIDDYLNRGEVEIIDCSTKPETNVEAEDVAVVKMNYKDLSNEDLIRLLNQKDTAIENYEHKINDMEKSHKTEVDNMNEYYRARLNEHTQLIHYYERKLNILKDIINIEIGGEK